MTRDQAIKILSQIWGGNPQHDLANKYADAFVALGMLKLDDPPPTLWELLRKHGIDLATAQYICNDAMVNGVSAPINGPVGGSLKP